MHRGVCDEQDSCASTANPRQIDTDLDGFGNACDADYDNDAWVGVDDFNRLRGAFGSNEEEPGYDPLVDIGGDGGSE